MKHSQYPSAAGFRSRQADLWTLSRFDEGVAVVVLVVLYAMVYGLWRLQVAS